MKKVLILTVVLAMFATSAMAVITGSSHDLSGYSTNTGDRLCVYCHTPHAATDDAPLWNRGTTDLSGAPIYGSVVTGSLTTTTIDMTTGDAKLCMTCHDGTLDDNLTNLNGAAAAPDFATITSTFGGASLLLDGTFGFTNDHPVGFDYDTTLVTDDGGLNLVSAVGVQALLFNATATTGEVWCSSCHDVHEPGTAAAGTDPFLRISNSNSDMCLTCHAK